MPSDEEVTDRADRFDRDRDIFRLRAEVERLTDDPELDGTDAAHPAWWRGEGHACEVLCREVNDILDGKEPKGTCREPWESTRRRLASLLTITPEEIAEVHRTDRECVELRERVAKLESEAGDDQQVIMSLRQQIERLTEMIAGRQTEVERLLGTVERLKSANTNLVELYDALSRQSGAARLKEQVRANKAERERDKARAALDDLSEHFDVIARTRDALAREVEKLKAHTFCAYCGEGFAIDDATASTLSEHIRTCPDHPMRAIEDQRNVAQAKRFDAERERDELRTAMAKLVEAYNAETDIDTAAMLRRADIAHQRDEMADRNDAPRSASQALDGAVRFVEELMGGESDAD